MIWKHSATLFLSLSRVLTIVSVTLPGAEAFSYSLFQFNHDLGVIFAPIQSIEIVFVTLHGAGIFN